MSVTIRQATAADYETIEALVRRVHSPRGAAENLQVIARDRERGIMAEFVAEEEHTIVGYSAIIFYNRGDNTVFGRTVVLPDMQRKGIGSTLTRERLRFLNEKGFRGTAISKAVTNHTGSQKMLYRTGGFKPTQINLGSLPDFSGTNTPDTAVVFVRHFPSMADEEATLYAAQEHRDFFSNILAPFCKPTFMDTNRTTTSEEFRERYEETRNQYDKPWNGCYISLQRPSAPANIKYLVEQGHYVSGIDIRRKDDEVIIAAYLPKFPKEKLEKENINVIPEAEALFDFVWKQYAENVERLIKQSL